MVQSFLPTSHRPPTYRPLSHRETGIIQLIARGMPQSLELLQSATCATFICMTRIITQRELRNQSAAVLREVEAGRTIVVTRNGTPIAELRPIQPRRFVLRATLAEAAARSPRIDAARFRADLDAVIDQRVYD